MNEKMKCIDSHVHLWKLNEFRYETFEWPNETSGALYKDFTLEDYVEDVKQLETFVEVKGLIYVQVYHTEKETEQIISLSEKCPLIKGIVGWTDLTSDQIDLNLNRLKSLSNGRLVGIRHLIQLESNEDWLLREDVFRGIESLQRNGLQCDLSCNPCHLKLVPALASRFPQCNFIVDHLAKIKVNDQEKEAKEKWNGDWFAHMKQAAQYPNVFCKLSGMMSENESWTIEQFEPFYHHVLECFGSKRCIYGADWPVFKTKCNIQTQFEITYLIVCKYFKNEKQALEDIFYNNAVKVYNLRE